MEIKTDLVLDQRYKIAEKIGEGGMGVVWKAHHQKMGDEVAIKAPLNRLDQELIRRFSKEARSMRRFSLECPYILNIEDIGEYEGLP